MRTVASLGEIRLIQRMSRRFGRSPSVLVGIGDDAAVLRLPAPPPALRYSGRAGSDARQAGVTRALIEGGHMRPRLTERSERKSVAECAQHLFASSVQHLNEPTSTRKRFALFPS